MSLRNPMEYDFDTPPSNPQSMSEKTSSLSSTNFQRSATVQRLNMENSERKGCERMAASEPVLMTKMADLIIMKGIFLR